MAPTLSDLRRIFYGAGNDESVSDAEYDFLKSAQAEGISAANLLTGIPVGGISNSPSRYFTSDASVLNAVAFTQNLQLWMPILVSDTVPIDRIGIEVTIAVAATTVQLGIYGDNEGWMGDLVIDAGSIDASTIGYKEINISRTLTRGQYWLSSCSRGGTPTLRSSTNLNKAAIGHFTPTSLSSFALSSYSRGVGVGAFAASIAKNDPLVSAQANAPRILIRAAP